MKLIRILKPRTSFLYQFTIALSKLMSSPILISGSIRIRPACVICLIIFASMPWSMNRNISIDNYHFTHQKNLPTNCGIYFSNPIDLKTLEMSLSLRRCISFKMGRFNFVLETLSGARFSEL